MSVDIEEIIGRELREVAHGLHIPPLPVLPQERPGAHRRWQALLVAAVVLLVVVCAVAIAAIRDGTHEPEPAPVPVPAPQTISRVVPRTPYVLDQRLYVGGEQVPGDWWSVQSGPQGWLAHRAGDTWWWGTSPEPRRIEEDLIGSTAISPNGKYVAEVLGWTDEGDLTGFDTAPGGEGMGATPIDLGDPAAGDPVHVRAVTDDGRVIAQGRAANVLWLPFVDGDTVDLSETAPGQLVLGNTAAGLVVTDGPEGAAYLAEISDAGVISKTHDLPDLDTWAVSPGARWLAWTPRGTFGGETDSVSSLEVRSVKGADRYAFTAPSGWAFRVLTWSWEDDDHLVSAVVRSDGDPGERLVRCSVEVGRCVLISAP
jgi:hypothetical protein